MANKILLLKFVGLTSVVMLVSCTSFHPLPLALPPGAGGGEGKMTKKKSLAFTSKHKYLKGQKIIKGFENMIDLQHNLQGYTSFYQNRADGRHIENALIGDLGYLGGLGGLAGGVAKSPEAAIAGLATTGVAVSFQDRYNLKSQGVHYQNASNVFASMHDIAAQHTYEYNMSKLSPSGSLLIKAQIHRVIRRLRGNQASVDVSQPNFTDLIAKIKAMDDASLAAKGKKAAKGAETPTGEDSLIKALEVVVTLYEKK